MIGVALREKRFVLRPAKVKLKVPIAFVLSKVQKYMPGSQALFQQPARTTGTSIPNYTLPLVDTTSLQGSIPW